jgi:glycerophosphoryl diester phosphodiesterase
VVGGLTLAEIKQLKARERIPGTRPANARVDDQLEIPTFQQVIDLAKSLDKVVGRKIGIYPETKHPTYFRNLGFTMEETLVRTLRQNGYSGKNARVFIQSFEVSNLKQLSGMTNLPLVQLLAAANTRPYDAQARAAR